MQENCCVCGEALDEEDSARCTICEQRFHLSWSTVTPAKNCGRVWVDERICAMRFMCGTCARLRETSPEGLRDALNPRQPPSTR